MPSATPVQSEAPAADKTETPGGNASDSEVIKEGTIKKEGNVVLKEISFVYDGKALAISDAVDDEKLESVLGAPAEKESHTYSADDGRNMDHLIGFTENEYRWPGLEIKTIKSPHSEEFKIFNIELTGPEYATARNIKVGDSLEKLKEVYPEGNLLGNGAPEEEDDYRYEPVNYVDVINFRVKDQKVESIHMFTLLD